MFYFFSIRILCLSRFEFSHKTMFLKFSSNFIWKIQVNVYEREKRYVHLEVNKLENNTQVSVL